MRFYIVVPYIIYKEIVVVVDDEIVLLLLFCLRFKHILLHNKAQFKILKHKPQMLYYVHTDVVFYSVLIVEEVILLYSNFSKSDMEIVWCSCGRCCVAVGSSSTQCNNRSCRSHIFIRNSGHVRRRLALFAAKGRVYSLYHHPLSNVIPNPSL